MGPKIVNFQCFALYKWKIITKCSLELDGSKNTYKSIYLEEIPPSPFYLRINMKSGGRCPSIVVSVICLVSGNNRYIIIGWMLLKKHAD